jgi:hypothetical protein
MSDKDDGNGGASLTLDKIPKREQVVLWNKELFDPV